MNIQDKVAVITGGASGLGAATARYFVKEKSAKVVIFDLNDDMGNALVSELGEDQALFVNVDVTDEIAVREAVDAGVKKFGTVHICVNCAGIPVPCKILDREGKAASLEKFTKVINVNLIGMFNVMGKCAEKMALNAPENGEERGVIVNVSSGAAYEGQIGQCAYSASKAGVTGLNFPAARELERYGIRVNAIAPGLFNTPMAQSLDQKVIDKLLTNIDAPKRMGHVDEFAHTCAYMVENSYLNGETIRLDAVTRMHAR